jgi:ribosomal protein S6--L-glutamate ligase
MVESEKRIGVLTVRGADYPPTRRLIEAAGQREWRVVPIDPYRLWPGFREGRPVLLGEGADTVLDAVMPRQGAEIKDACLPLISHMAQMGIRVINGRWAIVCARHKFFTLQALAAAGLPVARTVFAAAVDGVEAAMAGCGDWGAVLKPVSGRQGKSICRFRQGDDLPPDLAAELTAGRGVLVQEYLSPEGRRDYRVLVIGGEVAGAMGLAPSSPQEFRANVHLGGQGHAVDLSKELAEMAVRAASAVGLEIAGVDLIVAADGRHIVNEVNYSPGFRGLEAATGKDIAGAMIDYVVGVLGEKQAPLKAPPFGCREEFNQWH